MTSTNLASELLGIKISNTAVADKADLRKLVDLYLRFENSILQYAGDEKSQFDTNWNELLIAGTFIGQYGYNAFGLFMKREQERTRCTLDHYHSLLFEYYINRCLQHDNNGKSQKEASDFFDETMESLHALVYQRYAEYYRLTPGVGDSSDTPLNLWQEMAFNIVIPTRDCDDEVVENARFGVLLGISDYFKEAFQAFPCTHSRGATLFRWIGSLLGTKR